MSEDLQHDMGFNLQFRLKCKNPIYYQVEKTIVGTISRLALASGDWRLEGEEVSEGKYHLRPESGLSFIAHLKKAGEKSDPHFEIKGCVQIAGDEERSYFNNLNINGVGEEGWTLRSAQLGAIHSLMAHWSLSKDVATIVLPTGTGKTETMLVTSLLDQAVKTLVIVPGKELKKQIADKFATWGMLRKLGVVPNNILNPIVLVLDHKILKPEHLEVIKRADVVVSTPGLLADAPDHVNEDLKDMFSHVYFDEAHHVVAKQWSRLRSLFCSAKIVQFTATPYRNDKKPIEGKILYNYPLSKALEDECFSKISLITVDERHPKKKDKAIADAAMKRLFADRAQNFDRHRMMVRATGQAQAEELLKLYQDLYPKERIVLVHSKTRGKKNIIKDILEGKYDIVVCVDMLKEGFPRL